MINNITVCRGDLKSHRGVLINTIRQHLTPLSDDARFDWLYRGNPHGNARVWLALDADNGEVVGMASAFPRRVYVSGQEKLAWVLGDFCIDRRYRSLGPALKLQRACLAAVDAGSVAFCYDFPSEGMLAIYKRLGVKPFGHMVRLAKLLRVDRKLGAIRQTPLISWGLCVTGNFLLALRDRHPAESPPVTLSLQQGECGEEFSTLAHIVGQRYRLCLLRSAAYLNWRYLSAPLHRYEILTARRNEVLLAYAIFSSSGADATIVDLFGLDEPATISWLVHTVVALLRQRGVVTVSLPMSASHPWRRLVQRLGFKARETCPVVFYAPCTSATSGGGAADMHGFLMHGDRDS